MKKLTKTKLCGISILTYYLFGFIINLLIFPKLVEIYKGTFLILLGTYLGLLPGFNLLTYIYFSLLSFPLFFAILIVIFIKKTYIKFIFLILGITYYLFIGRCLWGLINAPT